MAWLWCSILLGKNNPGKKNSMRNLSIESIWDFWAKIIFPFKFVILKVNKNTLRLINMKIYEGLFFGFRVKLSLSYWNSNISKQKYLI